MKFVLRSVLLWRYLDMRIQNAGQPHVWSSRSVSTGRFDWRWACRVESCAWGSLAWHVLSWEASLVNVPGGWRYFETSPWHITYMRIVKWNLCVKWAGTVLVRSMAWWRDQSLITTYQEVNDQHWSNTRCDDENVRSSGNTGLPEQHFPKKPKEIRLECVFSHGMSYAKCSELLAGHG